MKQFTKGIVSFLLAVLLLTFPGSVVWEFLTKPDPVDKKDKIVSICMSYHQAAPLVKVQILLPLNDGQVKAVEQAKMYVEQDSVYVDNLIVLISKTTI